MTDMVTGKVELTDVEATDDEVAQILKIVFDRSKRTPEQTQRAIDRLRAALKPSKQSRLRSLAAVQHNGNTFGDR